MIQIDGSSGEGGGQILRSSLALSIVTGTPFRIVNIRAKRRKPGLMRQHLTAVLAAAEVCGAEVRGAAIGSAIVDFHPGEVQCGDFTFSVGTAGSTSLVLQSVLLPLMTAREPSRIVLEGGTHNPFAPPFDFLQRVFLPHVNRMGPKITLKLERPGFYPAGGGRVVVDIAPAESLKPIDLLDRGEMRRRRACATVSSLPRQIAEREIGVIRDRLGFEKRETEIVKVERPVGPGNVVMIELEFEHVTEVFTGFGEVRRPAEAVATHAVQQCRNYLKSEAPVGEFLTDQLMLPLAVAGAGRFRSTGLSRHAETHLKLIREFLDVPMQSEHNSHDEVTITFGPE